MGLGSGSAGTSGRQVTIDTEIVMGDICRGLGNGSTASMLSTLHRQPVLPDANVDVGHVPHSKCNAD